VLALELGALLEEVGLLRLRLRLRLTGYGLRVTG
jgi:hypothetical protein